MATLNLVQRLGILAGIGGSLVMGGCVTPQGRNYAIGLTDLEVRTAVVEGVKRQVNPDAYPANVTVNMTNSEQGQRLQNQNKGIGWAENMGDNVNSFQYEGCTKKYVGKIVTKTRDSIILEEEGTGDLYLLTAFYAQKISK